jgi:hypothetical protein
MNHSDCDEIYKERAAILMRLYSSHGLRQAGFQRKKRCKQSSEGLGVKRKDMRGAQLDIRKIGRTPNLGGYSWPFEC